MEELEKKVEDLQSKLEKTKREKRNMSDELNSLKFQIRKSKLQNESSSFASTDNRNNLNGSQCSSLNGIDRDYSNISQPQNTLAKPRNQRAQSNNTNNSNNDKDVCSQVENEIFTFTDFATSFSFNWNTNETHEAIETLNHLKNDEHLHLEDKISPFFTALRSLVVSAITQSRTLRTQDLEETHSMIDDIQNQNKILKNQVEKLNEQNRKSQEVIISLKKQIISEHKLIANFTQNLDPAATSVKLIDNPSFVKSQIKILADAMVVDYSRFQQLIEKDFGKLETDQITLPDLLEYAFSKFQEVDNFINKLYNALEVDSETNDFDSLLTILQKHLAIIPKLQSTVKQFAAEKETLDEHCKEMDQLVQKQSQDFGKSHKNVVQKLQQQIKDLQRRCNETKLEELTQVLSDKDQETRNLTNQINELEEKVSIQNQSLNQTKSDLSRQSKKFEELNATYEASLQRLAAEQSLTSNLKNQVHQREMRIKELEEDLNNQIAELTITNEQLRHTTENEQRSEIDELHRVSERSIFELKQMKKKAKKYQSQLHETETTKRDLEARMNDLTGIQEQQTMRISELQTKLKQTKMASSKISEEYSTFQQAHLKIVAKLNDSQAKVKSLSKQTEFLSNQLAESQNSIHTIESTSCSKKELEKCYQEIHDKDKTIRKLKTIIMKQGSSITSMENRQMVLEEFRDKYNEEHEFHRLKSNLITNVTTIVKEIHTFFTTIFMNRPNASQTLISILQKTKPLFEAFSLPMFSFDFVRPITFSLITCRIANTRPNPDLEALTTQHKVLLTRIADELMEFPNEESHNYTAINTLSTTSERLSSILDMTISARKLFEESNESMNTLTSLVKNQHSAIVRMSQNSPKRTPT